MAEENPADSGPKTNKESAPSTPPLSGAGAAPEVPKRTSRAKRRRLLLIGAVAVVVLVVGGILLWLYFSRYESTDDAQVDVHLYPVSARISGYVLKVNVDDNQWVQQGTVLVEIDPKDYQVAVTQAQANLASAEATAQSLNITIPVTSSNTASETKVTASDVATSDAGVIAAEKQVAVAHAQLEQAEANDVKAQDDVRRYKMLIDKQEVAEQIYDYAVAAAKASAATVAAARANEGAAEQAVDQARSRLAGSEASHQSAADTATQQVSSSRDRARAALADVEQKRAALEQAELNLQYTEIVAPVSGEVNKTVVVGMNVEAGQQLLTVVPLDEVWITANFKQTQLKHLRPGERAEIHVSSLGRTFKGHVDSVAGATGPVFSLLPPENATGNYVEIVQRIPVKIILDPGENADHQLLPGMNVTPDVYLK
ncbi:MAG: HlyD family secretion protein [Candidatus Acidiferrales bacterium]